MKKPKPARKPVAARKPAAVKRPASPAVKPAPKAASGKAVRPAPAAAKKAKKAPVRKLALGSAVACCSAEAVAASLRLTGWPVSDADVLALYLHTTRDLDAGAPIVATLEAAAEYGLAGMRLLSWEARSLRVVPSERAGEPGALVLGVDLPGPHAVLDTGSEWITWGERWPVTAFPDAVIEEAWTARWEAP